VAVCCASQAQASAVVARKGSSVLLEESMIFSEK
jgi:hypothetical protein